MKKTCFEEDLKHVPPWGGQLPCCGWCFALFCLVFLNMFPLWVLGGDGVLFLFMDAKEGGSETFCPPTLPPEARARHMTVVGKGTSLAYPVPVTKIPFASQSCLGPSASPHFTAHSYPLCPHQRKRHVYPITDALSVIKKKILISSCLILGFGPQ